MYESPFSVLIYTSYNYRRLKWSIFGSPCIITPCFAIVLLYVSLYDFLHCH